MCPTEAQGNETLGVLHTAAHDQAAAVDLPLSTQPYAHHAAAAAFAADAADADAADAVYGTLPLSPSSIVGGDARAAAREALQNTLDKHVGCG
jgi:hypothetical protein